MGCGSSSQQSSFVNRNDSVERRRLEEERRIALELERNRRNNERREAEEEEKRKYEEYMGEKEEGNFEDDQERHRRKEEEDLLRRMEADRLRAEEDRIRAEEERLRAEEEEKKVEEARREEEERKRSEENRRCAEDDEEETPFDDDGFRDSESYNRTDLGLMVKSLDFREHFLDGSPDERPKVQPGSLYTDEEFPLEIAIVEDHSKLEWKRPYEFVQDPRLFTEGATRFDIGQGAAGTCWFLSTVANIAGNEKMLKQVIPDGAYMVENENEYDGVFHARFYRFGRWEDVYIDDFLPVIYGNVLWGAKSATDTREMWVALLEKAFARLYGSYDAIYGGQPGDAYLLLTGGIGERIDIDDHIDKASKLFQRIANAIYSGCQVACVVPDEFDEHQGLVGGHAYSLVGTEMVSGTKLIRVRNPWGHGEWTGPWSDGSPEWNTIPNNAVKAPNKDDGEFYVSLDDFMTYFSQTTICSLTPDMDLDGTADSLNHVLSIYGEWVAGKNGGFHKIIENPRFCFTLTEEGVKSNGLVPFVIQIIQHSEKRKTDNISMRCDIFRILGDKIKPACRNIAAEIQGTKNNVYTPELQTSYRHWLKPGKYIVIPSTVDAGVEKAFLIRLFSCSPLLNVTELPLDAKISVCEYEVTMDYHGCTYDLTFEKTLFGDFKAGWNAGGQVSNASSYHKNPQYLISVPDKGGEIPLVIHIMQGQQEPQYPVGIRLFKITENEKPPMDVKWFYDNYNDSPTDVENNQSKFMISWDVDVRYMLQPGRYVVLLHLDEPNTEKDFSIVWKSNNHISIKGFQT